MPTRRGATWMARVRTIHGQVHLGSFPTKLEASTAEYSYKIEHGIALTPHDGTVKSWQTRKLVGT